MTSSTVVVLHAHPDDEAIFTGATLAALAGRGVRVVLVTATTGGEGVPRTSLGRGETLADRRTAELERACLALGVQRLVLLGYGDSGAHAGPYPSGSLGRTPTGEVARRLEQVVTAEGADALVHYDPTGIYGHVDHVQVHRAGDLVARRLGLPSYEATVDAASLLAGPGHVLQQAAGETLDGAGVDPARISFAVRAGSSELAAKHAAMAAHASQIGPEHLVPGPFEASYGREWFVRGGPPSVLEAVLADRLVPAGHLSTSGV